MSGKQLDLNIEIHIAIYKELKARDLATYNMVICLLDAITGSKNPRLRQIEELYRDLQELGEKSSAKRGLELFSLTSTLIGGSHLRDACLKKVPPGLPRSSMLYRSERSLTRNRAVSPT